VVAWRIKQVAAEVRGDPIFLEVYLLCPWWLAICIMHFCFISLSDRPVFLAFSEVMQVFIFGSCPTLSPVSDGMVAFDESLFMSPLGVCDVDEFDGVIVELVGGVD
jgi:hypothetical protein